MKAPKPTPLKAKAAAKKRATKQQEKPVLRSFFVPGYGEVKAASIDDVGNQLKSEETREVGDGNS